MPTRSGSPSVRGRARLRDVVSVPGSGPPAAVKASATREPAGSRRRPGLATLPLTSMVSRGFAAGVDAARGGSVIGRPVATGGICTVRGRPAQ
jgi:hypothetical protein